MAAHFGGARDFNVEAMDVENIDRSYIDERHTRIDEDEVGFEIFDQDGAIAIVNGDGQFSGTINFAPPPAGERGNATREHSPGGQQFNRQPQRHRGEESSQRRYRPDSKTSHSRPPRPEPSGGKPTYFQNAERFRIDTMDIRNVSGDRIDKGTTHVKQRYIGERVYNQRSAIGVVNDSACFSGVINYGFAASDPIPHGDKPSSRNTRYRTESCPPSPESHSPPTKDRHNGSSRRQAFPRQASDFNLPNSAPNRGSSEQRFPPTYPAPMSSRPHSEGGNPFRHHTARMREERRPDHFRAPSPTDSMYTDPH